MHSYLEFLVNASKYGSAQYMRLLRTALRSFLRYLYFSGKVSSDFSESIPKVGKACLATIPKTLSGKDVEKVINSCNRKTKIGKRDYAIIMLLSRLGLRASEVATLKIHDIDWQQGLISLHSKGNKRITMPLPIEVGEAIADYIKNGRSHTDSHTVFIRHNAPHISFSGHHASCCKRCC
jgi:integrase/recombinase XerD